MANGYVTEPGKMVSEQFMARKDGPKTLLVHVEAKNRYLLEDYKARILRLEVRGRRRLLLHFLECISLPLAQNRAKTKAHHTIQRINQP